VAEAGPRRVVEEPVEEIERSAGSVEEAVEAALAELGISEQEARITVIQEPKQGFLGFKGQQAIVRVQAARSGGAAAGEASDEPEGEDDELLEDQTDAAVGFLEGLLEAMGLPAEVDAESMDGIRYVQLWGEESAEDMGLLIGKRGHTLEALQELTRSYVQRQTGERCRLVVDVEDYRKRRRSQLVRKAKDAARQVRKTGRSHAMEPMSAFERKIVHDAVSEVGGVETESEGEEPNRRVVIRLVPAQ
jgi:spoIIIJ-associated protein